MLDWVHTDTGEMLLIFETELSLTYNQAPNAASAMLERSQARINAEWEEGSVMKLEYSLARILCAFVAGFSLAIAITTSYWMSYVSAGLGIVAIVVVFAVEKHNRETI